MPTPSEIAKNTWQLGERVLKLAEAILANPDLKDPVNACYHAHQAIEKFLKTVLILQEVHPPRTHSLEYLQLEVSKYIQAGPLVD